MSSAPACSVCNEHNAVTSCKECKSLACGHCSRGCQVCGQSLCRHHIKLTSKGYVLCKACRADRRERKKAQKARQDAVAEQKSQPSQPASSSFESLTLGDRSFAPTKEEVPQVGGIQDSAGMSFEDLADGPSPLSAGKSEVELNAEAGFLDEADFADMDPMERERLKKLGRVEAEVSATGRLELPPMDERKPILSSSGYQPPSRARYIAAFAFCGIGMFYFWSVNEDLRELMVPWKNTAVEYNSNQTAVIQDTNALRDSSNINSLVVFSQAPMFFVAWAIFLAYVGGMLALVISVIRSWWWSYNAKIGEEALKEMETADKNELLN